MERQLLIDLELPDGGRPGRRATLGDKKGLSMGRDVLGRVLRICLPSFALVALILVSSARVCGWTSAETATLLTRLGAAGLVFAVGCALATSDSQRRRKGRPASSGLSPRPRRRPQFRLG